MDKLDSRLAELEAARLVARAPDEELVYWFRHALTQEAAYESLLLKKREELHHAVASAYERLEAGQADENAALLAYHYEVANDREKALYYLQRAARWARRAAAHREEAELLGRAIAIANKTRHSDLAAELHARRGQAFASLAQYGSARTELESALAALPTDKTDERAEVLAELAIVCHWLLDVPSTRRYAGEAVKIAEQVGRNDLAAGALSALALADSSDGLTREGLKNFERAFASGRQVHSLAMATGREMSGILLYWLGHFERSVERNREAARMAEELNDSAIYMRALGDLGLALTGCGRYAEALATFRTAREFGKKQALATWMARAIAMESGCHLSFFDFRGAEKLAEEARELARSSNFIGPVVSAGIDLLFNYVRRQELESALYLVPDVAAQVERAEGSHGWLWRMRFAQVRAELALLQEDWEEAIRAADEALARSRATGRVKYTVSGLAARGQALVKLGRRSKGMADIESAVYRARKLDDPAVFLLAAAARLAVEGDDATAAEARRTARRMAGALPTDALREQFEAYVSELF